MSSAPQPHLSEAFVEADHKPSFKYADEPERAGCFRNSHMSECRCPLVLAHEEATKMMFISIDMARMMTQTGCRDHQRQAVAQLFIDAWLCDEKCIDA